jgi:NAD(P)-dependent dehydrogenase (short-subunit alcohol dehydrogenase family)
VVAGRGGPRRLTSRIPQPPGAADRVRGHPFSGRATIRAMAWHIEDIPDLRGRVAVVTGASGGLGFETVRALARTGAHVAMTVRSPEKGATARDRILAESPAASLEVVELDVSSLASVRDGGASILAAHPRIDILVNNAGVMGIPRRESADGQELQLATNHLGHFALTALLMPALLRSDRGRVVSISSTARFLGRTVDPADVAMRRRYDPWRAYGRSKLAAAQFTIELDRRLVAGGAPVRALAADPGFAHTDLQARSAREARGISQRFFDVTVGWFGSSPAEGALPQIRAATDPAARGGSLYALRFVVRGAPVRFPYLVWGLGDRDRARLWSLSERETGVTFDVAATVRAARAGEGRPWAR